MYEYVCGKSKFYKSTLVVLKVSNCVRVETFMKKDVIFLKSYLRSSFSKFKSTARVPLLDFLVPKIKEREFQNIFCRSLPYFYTYPGKM